MNKPTTGSQRIVISENGTYLVYGDIPLSIQEIISNEVGQSWDAFMNLVEAAKHYPCLKKAWVEFLGEKTDAVTERIE